MGHCPVSSITLYCISTVRHNCGRGSACLPLISALICVDLNADLFISEHHYHFITENTVLALNDLRHYKVP